MLFPVFVSHLPKLLSLCYIGGKRKLRIPPELAYGPEPAGCFSGGVQYNQKFHILTLVMIIDWVLDNSLIRK